VKAMPYIKLGLTVLKVAYVAGRLAGFPVPDVAGVVGDWIDGQLGELSSLAGEATAWLGAQTEDQAFASSLLAQVDENARKAIAGEIDAIKPLEGDALGDKMRAPLEKSFEELDTLLESHGDWREKSGLVFTTSKADGTSEYVLETDKPAYEEHGASLIASEPPPQQPARRQNGDGGGGKNVASGRTFEAGTGEREADAAGKAGSVITKPKGCCESCSLQ
jgi:hypothetical protein